MTERTESTSVVNPNPNPESQVPSSPAPAAPAEQAAPSPEVTAAPAVDQSAVQQAVQQAAEQAAEAEQTARAAAEKTRQAAVKAYVRGETGYAAGLLECGRLCGEYTQLRLGLGDKREAAITALRDGLTPFASDTPDPSRLILVYQASVLMPAGKAKCPATVYGVMRDHWCRLLERTAKDTPQESYVLIPGREQECRDLHAAALKDSLSRDAIRDGVRKLVELRAADQARAAAEQRQAAAEKAAAEKAGLEEQAAQLRAAREEHEQAQAAAKADASETTTAAVEESAAKLLAQQKAVLEQQARSEQAERKRLAAEKRAKADAERLAKAADKAAARAEKGKAAEKPATTAPGQQSPTPGGEDKRGQAVTGNLLRSAAAGTAKDVGDMAAEFLLESEQPDDALEAMLTALSQSSDLSAKAQRACKAALVILTRQDKPKADLSPVDVANRLAATGTPAAAAQANGQAVTAA